MKFIIAAAICLSLFLPIVGLFNTIFKKEDKKSNIIIYSSDENTHWSCHFNASKHENRPCFTFDQIKTFYYTAPEKWKLSVYDIYYYKNNNGLKRVAITTPTKKDYVLTLRFLQEQEKNNQKQKQIQATLDLLPYLRKDAQKAQDEADKMLAKCEEDIQNIAKNLEREKRLTYENSILM